MGFQKASRLLVEWVGRGREDHHRTDNFGEGQRIVAGLMRFAVLPADERTLCCEQGEWGVFASTSTQTFH